MSATDQRGRVRVAVTGMGIKTGAGLDIDAFWSTIVSGRSTAATIQRFDPSPLPVRFGCEVLEFDPTEYLGVKDARHRGEPELDTAHARGLEKRSLLRRQFLDVALDHARERVGHRRGGQSCVRVALR